MKRSRLWLVLVAIALAVSLSSCTMYTAAKKEVFPGVKQIVVAAGPHLIEALLVDLGIVFSWLFDQGEKLVGYGGPTDTVPPAK